MVASVCTSSAPNVWTADRLDRSAEGKADGLDRVVVVLEEMSMNIDQR